jgi:hypothetical protein
MTAVRLVRWQIGALMCLACWSCSQSQPSAPSLASVAGIYKSLRVTRCNPSGASAVSVEDSFPPLEIFVFGPSVINPWTLSQVGGDVSGSTSGQVPPFHWSGTLTGRVVSADTIEITTLTYQDGSSHGGIHMLSGIGVASVDASGISGVFAGDYENTPTFGGISGTTMSCHGTQMAFRFSRTQ